MSGKRTLSLSAYKKSKEALAVAPAKRLGFGESVSTREARAQVLQLETQVIGRLDDLLKRCGKDPGSAQAISNWLCAEGLEGHAKKGLSRILCHVKVWSRILRSEGVTPKGAEEDAAEVRARAAFGACVSAINAVDSLSYRFDERNNARNGEFELVKVAGEVLAGMADAMLGAGAKPRSRGLHPTEHAQLSRMVDSWRTRGAMPSPSLEGIGKLLAALRPSDDVDSSDNNGSSSSGSSLRSSKVGAKSEDKRAAWARVPAAAVRSAGDDSPTAAATSGPAGVGRLSPTRPSSGGAGGRLPAAPQTEGERQAGLEAALKELLSRNVAMAGGWWAQAFQGSGPFPQGPEGCWSLHFRRSKEDPELRQKQAGGLIGVNGEHRRDSGVDLGGIKTEAVDGMDSDAAPSTPSTVPSEASPSPERSSPLPEVKPEEEQAKDLLEAKPAAVGRGENGTVDVAAQQDGKAPQDAKDSGSKEGAEGAKATRSPKTPALSKREEEEEERRRRKEEARRAGKEKGKAKALERERQKREREAQRQKMIADSRKKKADEEAARKEKEAKHKADELARHGSTADAGQQQGGTAAVSSSSSLREREKSRKRDQPAERGGGGGDQQPRGNVAAAEESRRGHRGGSSRSRERQDRTRDREGRDRAGGVDGKASARDAERAGDGGGSGGGGSGSGGREKDESRRRGSSGDSRGRSDKEGRGRGKDADRASSRRDKDESRRHHDRGESREAPSRGGSRGRQDQHDQPRDEDRGAEDGWRKRGSSSQRAREPDNLAGEGGDRTLDGRERGAGDKGERKRRRDDPSESEGASSRHGGGGDRYHDEQHADDDRGSSHRPSKKKSKKDKRDRRDRKAERQSDAAAAAAATRLARAGSEESNRGRKRSRELDGGPPPEGYAAAAAAPQSDHGRRSLEPHRQWSEPELGRNGGDVRDAARQGAGHSRKGSVSPRRGDRRDGSEKRARRGSAGDPSSVPSRPGGSRERHVRGGGRESAAGVSASGGGGGGGGGVGVDGGGGGLPGMEAYGSGASPPVGAELGGFGTASSGHDRQGLGSLTALNAYGPALGRGDSQDGGRRRRGNGGRESGGRPRLAMGDAYGPPGMDDSGRGGARSERDRSERDRSERSRSDRDRLEKDRSERDRSERDRSERDYSRSADKSVRESSGRWGDAGSRQSSSSNARGSRRSPERGTSAATARDGSYRRRPGSPSRDDSRGRSSAARDGRHSKGGGGGGGSSALSGGGSGSRAHAGMGMGSLGMGMGMGVSIIGGTPVLMPVAKMMEAASASSRAGDRRNGGRLDDRDRDRRKGGGGGRWSGGGGDEGGEDRWAGDSPSEDDLDHRAGGGRSEGHSRRRRDSGGSGSLRGRADSRDEGQAQGHASPPQEEEPEEGELVIESSTPAAAAAVLLPGTPLSPHGRKSRWGNLRESEASPFGSGAAGGDRSSGSAASRADRWPSRDGGGRSIGDGGDGEKKSVQGTNAESSERCPTEEESSGSRGSADAKAQRARRSGVKESPSGSREQTEEDPSALGQESKSSSAPADPVGTEAAQASTEGKKASQASAPLSPTTRVDERADSGSIEDSTGDVAPTTDTYAAGPAQKQTAAEGEAAAGQESTAPEAGEGGASSAAGAIRSLEDEDATGTPAGRPSDKIDKDDKNGEGDSDRLALSGGGAEAGAGAGADAVSRAPPTRRRSSGDLTPFLRRGGSRRKSGEPVSPAAPSTDATEPNGPAGTPPPDDGLAGDSADAADAAAAAAAEKPQRASVFSRLGAPPGEAKQDDDAAAATKTATGTPGSAPPRGIASTWGSGSSADWGTLSKDASSDGNVKGNGNGSAGAAPAAEVSDAIPMRRTRSANKDEARPVGGGAGRLMNAALSSSRDGRSGKKGGAGGRGRGGGRRQRE